MMKNRFHAFMFKRMTGVVLCVVSVFVWANPTAYSAPLESPTGQLVSKVLDATVRIETAGDRSSGVIISDLGHVLTVAHGVSATEDNILVIHSGGQYSARLVKHDADRDLALLQLINPPASSLPTINLAARTRRTLQSGQLLFATGCPAREANSAGPVVRMGSVKAVAQKYIRSNCALTAGDSGGPLVDSDGSIIGLNARIGAGRESNLHIPVGVVHSFFAGISGLKASSPSTTNGAHKLSNSASRPVVEQLAQLQVKVLDSDDNLICLGCRVDVTTVVTKLSLIEAKNYRVRLGKADVESELIFSSREHDVAVLKLVSPDTGSQHRTKLVASDRASASVGDLVYANASTAGIVGRIEYSEPTAKPVLGCTLLVDDQRGLIVEEVAENSAASDAKLVPEDRLVGFCGRPCLTLDDIGSAIAGMQPGDIVTFECLRAGQRSEGVGRLRHRPEELLNRTEFLDGRSGALSHRRTGFTNVIQHDVAIGPSEIGGPLLDSDGRLVGINIARRSRESVLAIPIDSVLKLIENSRAQH